MGYMDNVYEKVRIFYEQDELQEDTVFSREWVEGFLRQQAWHGSSDKQLDAVWSYLKLFAAYLLRQNEYVNDLDIDDYHEALQWIHSRVAEFDWTLANVRRFFAVLHDFFEYLKNKNIVSDCEVLQAATMEITGGKRLNVRKRRHTKKMSTNMMEDDSAEEESFDEIARVVATTIEDLMNRIGKYFQQGEFMKDFRRALYLYTGPFESVPSQEDREFWLGFWDYFLFDYHLIASDIVPLQYFSDDHADNLSVQEVQFLTELLNARYTVFYIRRIIDEDFVECINLFTNETFRLPQPEFNYQKIKRMLFFGHVFSGEITLINYVASIEVSPILRQRIKEELIMQKKIFEVKEPGATWQQFLSRQALNVKYTVDILLSLAKVNITPFNLVLKEYKKSNKPIGYTAVTRSLAEIMPVFGFSKYDIQLAQQLWADYCHAARFKLNDHELWAAAVIYIYSKINGHPHVMATKLAREIFKPSAAGIYSYARRLKKVLGLEAFDQRYLSEEGFIFMLLKN